MRAAAVLATLGFLAATTAVSTTTAAGGQPRVYRVSVQATLQERATYELTGDAACFWSARGVAVRHLDIKSPARVTVTAAQLARGVGVPLEVHEIRLANHNNVIGACTHLGPQISDPSDRCGKRTYRIPASAVKLRLLGGRLFFSFVRIGPDPYGNRCAPSVWGAVPQSGSAGLVATLRYPPKAVSAPVAVEKHGAVEETDAASSSSVATANSTLGRTDVSSDSWQVALTFG